MLGRFDVSIDFSALSRRSPLGRALRAPLRLIPPDAALRVLQGPLRGARWIAGASNHGCWLGSYEMAKQRLFAELVSPGDVVFDVGAHVGFYTLLASRRVGSRGRVIAFEPLPRNLRLLREHLARNRCANTEVVGAAVAARPGRGRFSADLGASEGSLAATGQLDVEVVAIDALVKAGRVPPPAVLKIDVEGAELEVLRGARETLQAASPAILLATHGAAVHQQCIHLLEALGYTVRPIGGAADELLALGPSHHRIAAWSDAQT